MPTDQVILARRRSWPPTMGSASSLSQSMKVSEQHLAVSNVHLPGAVWVSLSGIVVGQA